MARALAFRFEGNLTIMTVSGAPRRGMSGAWTGTPWWGYLAIQAIHHCG